MGGHVAGASMRAVILTDRGLAATNHASGEPERPNPFGLVRPRCIRCWRPLALCPGHGNAELPAGTP